MRTRGETGKSAETGDIARRGRRERAGKACRMFDSYGFVISEDHTEEESDGCVPSCSEGVSEKWRQLLNEFDNTKSTVSPLLKRCRQLVKEGRYHAIRATIWTSFLEVSKTRERFTFDYQENVDRISSRLHKYSLTESSGSDNVRKISDLLNTSSSPNQDQTVEDEEELKWLRDARQIMLDIDRTFPNHRMFIGDTKEKVTLFRVLMLYSKFNTAVGYCQGMAYVAALLIMHMEKEEDVFWSLVTLFESEKYLKGFYDTNLSRMKKCAAVFELMLKDRHTQLSHHLGLLSIHPLMYITSWFMCLFTTLPCWDTVLTLCDMFFLEGSGVLFRGALAIMGVCSAELMAMDQLEQILPFIQKLPSRLVSHNVLLPVFWRTTVNKSDLEHYTTIATSSSSITREFKTPRRTKIKKTPAVVSTPVTQSFLSRIITALTPISATPTTTTGPSNHNQLPSSTPLRRTLGGRKCDLDTSRTMIRSGRKRKRENQENSNPSCSGAIEMRDISSMTKRHHPSPSLLSSPTIAVPQSFDFSPVVMTEVGSTHSVCETPSSRLGPSSLTPSSNSPYRRSLRVAQRKKGSNRKLPITTVTFRSSGECPVKERLRQCDSAEKAAFQTFSTSSV